jgi:hypothetical protein
VISSTQNVAKYTRIIMRSMDAMTRDRPGIYSTLQSHLGRVLFEEKKKSGMSPRWLLRTKARCYSVYGHRAVNTGMPGINKLRLTHAVHEFHTLPSSELHIRGAGL